MDFIFYGLGGDLFDWREAALKCETVFVEATLNGNVVSLARDISNKSTSPMKIFPGKMEDAFLQAQGWESYPYSRGAKESFSQVLFQLLNLPEVKINETDESSSKITMNQVLRLLYSDQLSPVDSIFRFQAWDDVITRQTVGEFLCGAFSAKYYAARLRLVDALAEYKVVDGKIKALQGAEVSSEQPLTVEWLNATKSNYSNDLKVVNEQIAMLERDIFDAQFEDRLTLNDQEAAYKILQDRQNELATVRERIDQLTLEIADSDYFILALEKKLDELRQSDSVIESLKSIEYEVCPACLSPIASPTEGACSLCKTPHSHEVLRARSVNFINEFSRQREESLALQKERKTELERLESALSTARSLWEQAGRHYTVSVRTPTTEIRARLRELNRRAGYLIRQLEDLSQKEAIVLQLAKFFHDKEVLNNEISNLRAQIQFEHTRSMERMARARELISTIVIDFLKSDLERQSTFKNAEVVSFEFDANRIAVNGDRYFSASSMAYLKNSFVSGFALAAANDPQFVHPRFMLLDTVEDKGMEMARSQNFQKLLARYSLKAKSEHQFIIATSMIAPELNVSDYTVGEFYTHENRTLKFP
ncbi:MAG: hypothetical protein QM801_05530 [Aestuariivirga sp.]